MYPKNFIVFCQLLLIIVCSAKAVKIGISKPLAMTTTQPPNTTYLETTTEEESTETPTTTTEISTTTTLKTTTTTTTTATITTTKPFNIESEWPEFPPRKNVKPLNKTTTTTIKPATTTTTLPEINEVITTTEKPEIPGKTLNNWFFEQDKYCFCDLNMDMCDINCCCDRDCSLEAFKVFRCLKEEPVDLEIHEGRFEDFKFQHGLPSCEINDGWLCVFRTNMPALKKEVRLTYSDTTHYYQWPNLLLEAELTENRDYYKYGDILKMINVQTKDIQNLELPSSFKTPFCQIQEPIYYLKSFKRSCLLAAHEKYSDIQEKLFDLQKNYKILKKPLMEDLYNDKKLAFHTGNITLRQCHESIENCLELKEGGMVEMVQLFKVKVNLLHNFTHIQEVRMELWLKDKKDLKENIGDSESWLEYEVEFVNKTLKIPFSKKQIISGPLGYLQGKPLILAKYVPYNNSLPMSLKNQILNYFQANNSDSNTLSLFNKQQGICQKNLQKSPDLISFGINEAKQCKVRLEDDILLAAEPAKINFTQICLTLQELIHQQLFGFDINLTDLSSYFISQLGRPQNNSHKWINLEVLNVDFNSVYGQYLEVSNTFICRNILLSLTYEFHTATYMVDAVALQNIVEHAVLNLGERHDLEFALDENLEVPITLSVRFYDMHEKAVSVSSHVRIFAIELLVLSLVLVLYM